MKLSWGLESTPESANFQLFVSLHNLSIGNHESFPPTRLSFHTCIGLIVYISLVDNFLSRCGRNSSSCGQRSSRQIMSCSPPNLLLLLTTAPQHPLAHSHCRVGIKVFTTELCHVQHAKIYMTSWQGHGVHLNL